jgi:hypothetical protein
MPAAAVVVPVFMVRVLGLTPVEAADEVVQGAVVTEAGPLRVFQIVVMSEQGLVRRVLSTPEEVAVVQATVLIRVLSLVRRQVPMVLEALVVQV